MESILQRQILVQHDVPPQAPMFTDLHLPSVEFLVQKCIDSGEASMLVAVPANELAELPTALPESLDLPWGVPYGVLDD